MARVAQFEATGGPEVITFVDSEAKCVSVRPPSG
jgi:hypothetical protein